MLAENLPSASTYFDVTFDSTYTSYNEFYSAINEQQFVGASEPYRFGSYEVYKASQKNYDFQINMFVNATSEVSVPYFSQYMYESIFTSVRSDIQFNVVTAPFPVFYVFKSKVAATQALDFAVFVSIALALIPCVIISFIIKER
jgi:hypothetical protein